MSIVVPARSYAELMRILPDADDPIDITVTPNKSQVLFHVEGIDLVSRLIEGQFPNYEPVIPTAHSSRAVIDRESFLAGARRASIFARDSANIVKVEVGGENGEGIIDHGPRRRRGRQRRRPGCHGRGISRRPSPSTPAT